MRIVAGAFVGLLLSALAVFVVLDELDTRADRARHLARMRHVE